MEQPSTSGLPGESGDLEVTPQVGLKQETPGGSSDGASDWNGKDHYCNSYGQALSQQEQEAGRQQEDDENQQHVTRAEKVAFLPCKDEEVLKHPAVMKVRELQPGALSRKRKCPNRSNQELSSGAVRGEVYGDNLSEEGTRN